jgi:hypothetical protein
LRRCRRHCHLVPCANIVDIVVDVIVCRTVVVVDVVIDVIVVIVIRRAVAVVIAIVAIVVRYAVAIAVVVNVVVRRAIAVAIFLDVLVCRAIIVVVVVVFVRRAATMLLTSMSAYIMICMFLFVKGLPFLCGQPIRTPNLVP